MKLFSFVELLESRIAPAGLSVQIVNPHQATYHDVDGDLVTVTVSSGTLATGLFIGTAAGQLQTLDLSGGGFDHANLVVTIKKMPGGDGFANIGYLDSIGHDLGSIKIHGDLGQIDAGDTTADGGVKSLTVNSIGDFGTDTQDSANIHLGLESNIINGLGALTVAHDVRNAFLSVTGFTADADGTIGPVKIGGSLIGGNADGSGQIRSTGQMGAVTIGEDLRGGSGTETGMINSNGSLGNVTVKGAILGGFLTSNTQSGEIHSVGPMGAIKIGHDIVYGSGNQSAYIEAENATSPAMPGTIASVTIGGSLIGNSSLGGAVETGGNLGSVKIGGDILGGLINGGGTIGNVTLAGSLLPGSITSSGVISSVGNIGFVNIGHDIQGTSVLFSGLIFSNGNIKGAHIGGSIFGGAGNTAVNVGQTGGLFANGDIGPVTIVHNLVGGKNGTSHANFDTGVIEAGGSITSVAIGGSIISGTNFGAGTLARSGAIIADHDIGSLTIRGSILGAPGSGSALIAAEGQASPPTASDLAIGKIVVGHRVENAQILAGYDFNGTPANADAQIGPITVGGDWIASSLAAGAINLGADHMPGGGDDNLNLGNPDDMKITAGTDRGGVLSKIASITIKGQVIGTPASTNALDHFGFVAATFGAVRIAGVLLKVPAMPGLLDVGQTNDVSIDKIA